MALTFGAASSHRVNHAASASLNDLTAFTYLAAVFCTTRTTGRVIIGKGQSTHKLLRLSGGTGNVELFVGRSSTSTSYITSDSPVAANSWVLLAATYDAAASPSGHIYSGGLNASITEKSYGTSTAGSGTTNADNTQDLVVGNSTLNNASFQGRISFVGIWNRVLSLGEIQALLRHPIKTSGCVLLTYYGENGTSTQVDRSGNGNSGTVTSATLSASVPLPPPYAILPGNIAYVPVGALPITPDPVAMPLTVPAPTLSFGTKTLTPTPVDLPITVPAPSIAKTLTLTPSPVATTITVPAPTITLTKTLTPTPVPMPLVVRQPLVSLGLLDRIAAYWPLDEASGNALDSFGSETLTDTNTVTTNPGKIATARQFTAASVEYLTRADDAVMSTGDIDFCFSAWVYVDSGGANRGILSKWNGPNYEYLLYLTNATNRFRWFVGGGVSVTATTFGGASMGTWYHVYVEHNAADDTIGISINNGPMDTASLSGGPPDGGGSFTIGADVNDSYYWDGRIDEVGFWKRCLSAAERTALYNGGAGLAYPFGGGLAPSPVAVSLVVPAPTLSFGTLTLTPPAVAVPLAIPAPTVVSTYPLAPAPVTVPLAVPAPSLLQTYQLAPNPVPVPIVVPSVTLTQGARTILPDPVAINLVVPDPTLEGFFELEIVAQVLVDWNQDGDFSDPEDDISPYIRAWVVDRGRDTPNALAGRSLAGRFEAVLDNRDGRFSEFNPDSPYFGSIHNGVPVRLNFTTPNVGVQFEGKIEDITPTSALGGTHTASLVAYGPLGSFAEDAAGGSGNDISTALYTNLMTGEAVGYILDGAGWDAAKRVLAEGAQPLATWWADNVNPLEALRELEDVEQGFLYETKDGKIAWEDRYYRYDLVSVATYSDAEGSPLSYQPLSSLSPARTIVNVVEVLVEPGTVAPSDPLVLWTGQVPMPVAAGESVTLIAVANLTLAANAFAVSGWTTPASGTDYGAWSNSDGTGTDLTASISVTVVKQAQRMYITYHNAAGVTAYIQPLQARGTLAIKYNPVVVSREDEDSQLRHGRHSRQIGGGRYLPDRSNARTIADFVLDQNKTPHPAFYMPIACGTPAHAIDLLSRDLSQRITLVASAAGTGFGVSADFIIESIHLEMAGDRVLRGTIGLSAQEVYLVGDPGSGAGFFTLDSSALDGPDILGF